LMPTIEAIMTDMFRRIQVKDYTGDQASLDAYSVVTKQLVNPPTGRTAPRTSSPQDGHQLGCRDSVFVAADSSGRRGGRVESESLFGSSGRTRTYDP
jgi:hypothetical protein